METFDFAVLNEVPSKPSLRGIITQYGDGYEQATGDGINAEVDKITLKCSFSPNQRTEAERLKTFLRSHGSFNVFLWKKPWETTAQKWRVESYNQNTRSAKGGYIQDYTIELKESFQP